MNRILILASSLALVLLGPDVRGASLAISPALVTNDYFGKINLTITGLPSAGQTIRLEKFYDLSTNGVVDAADPLMQSFLIRDGAQAIIGGATNLNVPADADSATNGQITVALNFPGLDKTFGLLEGSYLFRVSSPSNTFAAVQQSFTVRQKTYPQSVSGIAYSGTLANGLSNAFAVAFDANFTFNVAGPTNRTFQVLGSTNLANWSSLFATNPVSGSFKFTATNATATPSRSYRVLVQ